MLAEEGPSESGDIEFADKDEAFSNRVSKVLDTKSADVVTKAIADNDTNMVAAAIAANKTNLIANAIAMNETNLITAVQADEEVKDLQSDNKFNSLNESNSLFRFYFNNGLKYEIQRDASKSIDLFNAVLSEKRRITGRVRVRLYLDAGILDGDGDIPDTGEKSSLRRLRIGTHGRTYFVRPLTYGASFDATDGDFYLKEEYLWFHDIDYVKSFKIGVFNPPVSLGYLQSFSTIPMMERAAPISAFTPGQRIGLQIGGDYFKGRATLHGGFFGRKIDSDEGDSSQSYSRFVSRATLLPVFDEEDMSLVHLGFSLNHQFAQADDTRFKARPESYLSDYLVDTGAYDSESVTVYGVEAAEAKGSTSFQGESFFAFANDNSENSHSFWGSYLLVSHILTGEMRPYNTKSGTFGGVVPDQNFSFKNRHLGALELTARMSYTDLNSGTVKGGEMAVLSTGLNCYLTSQNRIMFIIGMADVNNAPSEGELYFIQSRFQIEF